MLSNPSAPFHARWRDLVAFYVLAVLIAVGVIGVFFWIATLAPTRADFIARLVGFIKSESSYMNLINIVRFSFVESATWLIVLFAAAPSIAAVVVVSAVDGRSGLKKLLGRLRPIATKGHEHSGWQAYQWLVVLNLLVCCALLADAWLRHGISGAESLLANLGVSVPLIVLVLFLGAFWDEGGVLEELGWRGYAQPKLMELLSSPLAAALVLGVLWWAWHLPRELPGLMSGLTPSFLSLQGVFLLLCLGQSVVIAYFVNRTGGSVLPAVMIHGGTNVWGKALSDYTGHIAGFGVRDLIVILGAIVIVTLHGRDLGRLPGGER